MKPHRHPYTELHKPWRWISLWSEEEAHETDKRMPVGVDEEWGRGAGLGPPWGGGYFQSEEGRQGQGMEGSKSEEDSREKGEGICARDISISGKNRHSHFLKILVY